MGILRFILPAVVAALGVIHTSNVCAGAFSDGRLYVGGGVGYSSYGSLEDLFVDPDLDNEFDDTAVGFGVFGGWELIPRYLSVELNYVDFGEVESELSETIMSGSGPELYITAMSGRTTTTGISLRGSIPFGDRLSAFAKLGISSWEFQYTYEDEVFLNGDQYEELTSKYSDTEDDNDLFFSVGMEYRLTEDLFIYGEYFSQQAEYSASDGSSYSWFEASSLMAGVRWQFSPPPRSSSRKKSDGTTKSSGSRDVTACDERFKDVSGLMCRGRD
ncbi:MAG: outer membrane beta-barrel protein [Ketobacter sp.]|nr:outer membrane beta-barrel protein [Ketobacter sp.]